MALNHPEDYYIKLLLNKVTLQEIMTTKVIGLHEDEPFSCVEDRFRQFTIRHLPIIDKNNKLTGLVTQRDLYRIQAPRILDDGSWYYDQNSLNTHILKNVMTKNPCTLHPEDAVAKAIMLMVDNKYGCIPIVDKNFYLAGIVTQYDILKVAAQILRE